MPDNRAVWKAVNGKVVFSSLKFSRLYSDLAKKLEEFLVHDALKQNEQERLLRVAEIYNDTKLPKYFNDAYTLAQAKALKQPLRDAGFYLQQFKLEAAYNASAEQKQSRTVEKNILQTLSALDKFYFINKLNYLAALMHYKKFLATEGEVVLAHEILAHLKQSDVGDTPLLAINYTVVQSLLEPENVKHFERLHALLEKYAQLFEKDTARNFYAFAINFCIRRINAGNLKFVEILLELYKEMLAANLMYDAKGNMSQFDFKNIVTVALRAGDAPWAEKFVRSYKGHIPVADRQNAYTFNMARLYFYQKKYNRVLPLLQNVEYSDVFYQLDSKTTLIKTYYELGEYLPLMALKESFRIMLRRKKIISEQNRINYMNFLRYTAMLYRADVKDSAKVHALRAEIAALNNVADKGWLLAKADELIT
ncbi:MAG: hypothetical protein JST49_14000 [Bacteroidetes bacterium]|nr:hypothetical protein [Bacteroidota bacterium]